MRASAVPLTNHCFVRPLVSRSGCSLRNTGRAYGAVIYAGHDTKVFKNATQASAVLYCFFQSLAYTLYATPIALPCHLEMHHGRLSRYYSGFACFTAFRDDMFSKRRVHLHPPPQAPSKRSTMERIVDRIILFCFSLLLSFVIVGAVYSSWWTRNKMPDHWYLYPESVRLRRAIAITFSV